LQRRVEAYHSRLQHATPPTEGVISIHNQTVSKEAGLEKHLKYDRWARNAFRLLLFTNDKTQSDFEALRLEETAAFAGGDYRIEQATPHEVKLAVRAPLHEVVSAADPGSNLCAVKTLKFDAHETCFDIACRIELTRSGGQPSGTESTTPLRFSAGLEMVVNLLAPNAQDRYFEFTGVRKPLEWSGTVDGPTLRLADEWQNVAVEIEARGASQFWVAPIETVSESEEGFERVHQGSQILGVWPVDLGSAEKWTGEAIFRVTTAR